jgi:alkylation response protein AidB-like acyl-CoA dehydrogenase
MKQQFPEQVMKLAELGFSMMDPAYGGAGMDSELWLAMEEISKIDASVMGMSVNSSVCYGLQE